MRGGPAGGARGAAGGRRRRVWYISPERFRELRHSCLLSREACAAFLGVCVRTVRHWDSGRNRVPWAAVKLLRLLRCGDLGALHPAWSGWVLRPDGDLVSGDGYRFAPYRLEAWPLVCEQARFWRRSYRLARGCRGRAPYGGALDLEAGEAFAVDAAEDMERNHLPLPAPCRTALELEPAPAADGASRPDQPQAPAGCAKAAAAVAAGGAWQGGPGAAGGGAASDLVGCEPARRGVDLPAGAVTVAAACRSVPTFNKGLKPPKRLQSDGILPSSVVGSLASVQPCEEPAP